MTPKTKENLQAGLLLAPMTLIILGGATWAVRGIINDWESFKPILQALATIVGLLIASVMAVAGLELKWPNFMHRWMDE